MDSELVKVLIQSAIAVGGAFLAANLAVTRFRKEKWWEHKAAIYSDLIGALHEMKWPAVGFFDCAMSPSDPTAPAEPTKLSDEESKRLLTQYDEARQSVRQIAERGSFYISIEVLKEIDKLDQALAAAARADSYEEACSGELAAINSCISSVKEIGRRDLEVGKA